ncbi:MAG: tRNA (adenosine(37)-N6)-threonylcarbamoyltransferase complex transferase subunit TsaD [Bacteroidetes bacterium]|nr:tRNA (adenosine(37)-N6)-threonylcarbamoyltransferase complex transferase subunit TsaD [Bacteroidota bacterium]MCK5765930.1 tRNA (adenosine(37)-N6)-threonylcarbamoyltransferase complex transferase subunit TsaD [Bacteroidales bacterium]
MSTLILGIESSCDDTSAAVTEDTKILANIVAGQEVHKNYGGVVPELASRAHQQNIIPVIDQALKQAKIKKNQLDAVAFTRGPGLLGSLLVGTSFAKAFALAADIPIIEVDHLQAHILAHFITGNANQRVPGFPFICLTVSGGHTQIIKVDDPHTFTLLGQTIDDAAGEAFDKAAKIMGLPYPGGPYIDKLAGEGNPLAYKFPKPRIKGLDYSFSGLKTSFLYTVRDKLREDASFIEKEKANLAASIQFTIIDVLLDKLTQAAEMTGISDIALAGGVSANSGLRKALKEKGETKGWNIFIPGFEFTTDNAAMIAIAGYFKYLRNDFASQDITPYTRSNF